MPQPSRLGVLVRVGVSALLATVAAGVDAQTTAITVDVAANRRNIDPRIYGVSFGDTSQLQGQRAPVNRSGGNAESRYNWEIDATNRGGDWYFESLSDGSGTAGAKADAFVTDSRAGGAAPYLTIPMVGYVAKLGPSRARLASFSIAKYGAQTDSDWEWYPDAGNGILAATGQPIDNAISDANVVTTPDKARLWVQHLVSTFGTAANGGVPYYFMDNEHSIWHSTHRDVHRVGAGMDEIRDKMIAYATAVKTADPTAKVAGPEEFGWSGFFYSGYDLWYFDSHGYSVAPDRDAHGGVDYMPWLLAQLRQHEQSTGTRILDAFTLHYYPEGLARSGGTSSSAQLHRNRATRSLWDPNYVDESWIGEPVRLIPRMRAWVDANYPGLEIGLTEYTWYGEDHISGATAQADALGIYGREGLNFAVRWVAPPTTSPTFKAFQMYRNYDGAGGSFGDVSVSAAGPNPDSLAVFGAERTADGAVTVMAINKSTANQPIAMTLAHFTPLGTSQVYRLDSANAIQHLTDLSLSGSTLSTTLPAQSITLFVIPSAAASLPTFAISNATVTEGNSGTKSVTLTVTLVPAASPVAVAETAEPQPPTPAPSTVASTTTAASVAATPSDSATVLTRLPPPGHGWAPPRR